MEGLETYRQIISAAAATAAVWLWHKHSTSRSATRLSHSAAIAYNTATKAIMLVMCPIVAFIAYAALQARADQQHIAYPLALIFIVSLLLVLIEVFYLKIIMDDESITIYSPWRMTRKIPWESIDNYHWSSAMQWHVLHSKTHGNIHLSPYLQGGSTMLEKAFETLERKYPGKFTPPPE